MACFALVVSSLLALLAAPASASSYIRYSTVPGYFLQDLNSTNATTFDYTATNFGLINQTYPIDSPSSTLTQWQRFSKVISDLNAAAPKSTTYKLLFMGRHGEGYHNAAESFYGTPAWNCYWSLLNGNSTTTWADAHLTSAGIAQALKANAFWSYSLTTSGTPPPQAYFTSPLTRCLATANLTFSALPLTVGSTPFIPTIKHNLREGISLHTCDRRSSKTDIAASFPSYLFEPHFPETDQLWNGVTAETSAAQDVRSKVLLDDVFASPNGKPATVISFTSHSGEIASLLRVLGHRAFSLSTGAIIPVLVKAEKIEGTSTTSSVTWSVSPHCTGPPVTSVSGGPSGGCVCTGATVTTTLAASETGPVA